MHTLRGCGVVGWNPTLQVEGPLAVGGVLTRGALEGVVAAGGELHGALAKLHRLFDCDDLQAGEGAKEGSSCRPAEAASAIMGLVGSVRRQVALVVDQ